MQNLPRTASGKVTESPQTRSRWNLAQNLPRSEAKYFTRTFWNLLRNFAQNLQDLPGTHHPDPYIIIHT